MISQMLFKNFFTVRYCSLIAKMTLSFRQPVQHFVTFLLKVFSLQAVHSSISVFSQSINKLYPASSSQHNTEHYTQTINVQKELQARYTTSSANEAKLCKQKKTTVLVSRRYTKAAFNIHMTFNQRKRRA